MKLIDVPSGAFTRPPPLFTLTCAVNVCVVPTGFAPFGVMLMFASTVENGSQAASRAG